MKAFLFVGESQYCPSYLENIVATMDHVPSAEEIAQGVRNALATMRLPLSWASVLIVPEDGEVRRLHFGIASAYLRDELPPDCVASFEVGSGAWRGLREVQRVEIRDEHGGVKEVGFVYQAGNDSQR